MNIYLMFLANEKQLPIWVTKWTSQVLRVTTIDELKGRAPYFGNPRVVGELFSNYGQGKPTETFYKVEDRVVSSPGTYNWRWVEPVDAKFDICGS